MLACTTYWTNLLVTPLTHSPDLETGAMPPKISACDLPNTYGLPINCMGYANGVSNRAPYIKDAAQAMADASVAPAERHG